MIWTESTESINGVIFSAKSIGTWTIYNPI